MVVQALCLSDLIPWIYLSLPLHNHKELDLGPNWMVLVVFPYFLQFKFEFCNMEFMIWATVSSQSCFSRLYRASSSLAAKNIINLMSVLTVWWCPCVQSSLVLFEEGIFYDQCIGKTLLTFALLHVVFQGQTCLLLQVISWLPIFAFQSPVMKRTSFFGVHSRRSCRSSQKHSASLALVVGA